MSGPIPAGSPSVSASGRCTLSIPRSSRTGCSALGWLGIRATLGHLANLDQRLAAQFLQVFLCELLIAFLEHAVARLALGRRVAVARSDLVADREELDTL